MVTDALETLGLTEDEWYLFTKSSASEGRIGEINLYEMAGLQRLRREAQVYIGANEMKATAAAFCDCRFGVYPISQAEGEEPVISYYDTDNELQVLAESNYTILPSDRGTSIIFGDNLPSVYDRPDAVVFELTVGYAADAIPELMKHAIIQNVCYWFDNPAEANKRFQTTFDYVVDLFRLTWV